MGLKTGVVIGFAVGYYFGARAGRERYEQIRELLGEFADSEPLESAQAALELCIDRVLGSGTEYTVQTPGTTAVPVAGPL
ncbi:MAG: hypothetical protein R3A49_05670 [Acidimicrobiia bacterium]